ncbi:MAG: hypothetical protein K0U98_11815 [Deltaproteobacteria bacterium]|nr:hypothetical protein [Deltaproteobacteria bacterium]
MSLHTHQPARYSSLLAAAVVLLVSALAASAADEVNVSKGGTLAGGPLALRGFDAVAYFTVGAPRLGSADLSTLHEGAVYRFSSSENQKAFEADPERYLPAYGGFCAYGISAGAKFDGDPEVFSIVDGRLFLNLSPKVQKKWQKDVGGHVTKADTNWKRIESVAIAKLK